MGTISTVKKTNEQKLDTIIEILSSVKKDFNVSNPKDIICALGGSEALLKSLIDELEKS